MKEPTLTDRAKDDLLEIWHRIAANRDERAADPLHREDSRISANLTLSFPRAAHSERKSRRDYGASRWRLTSCSTGLMRIRFLVVRILHGHRDVKRIMRRRELS